MTAQLWSDLPRGEVDIRLVVCDMDGTLLDGASRIPDGFWDIHDAMAERGIVFVPASGRQFATLKSMFEPTNTPHGACDYIAENGNVVIHQGATIWQSVIDPEVASTVITRTREASDKGADLGLVLCAAETAYVERSDPDFLAECDLYYASKKVVQDLTQVQDDYVKFAIYDFHDAEQTVGAVYGDMSEKYQPVVSGKHWIDIMDGSVNKGVAIRSLQEALGISREQTAVFGDYLNDLEMMAEGQYSFAMDNAHSQIKNAAAYLAPANTERGVVQVVNHLLGLEGVLTP